MSRPTCRSCRSCVPIGPEEKVTGNCHLNPPGITGTFMDKGENTGTPRSSGFTVVNMDRTWCDQHRRPGLLAAIGRWLIWGTR